MQVKTSSRGLSDIGVLVLFFLQHDNFCCSRTITVTDEKATKSTEGARPGGQMSQLSPGRPGSMSFVEFIADLLFLDLLHLLFSVYETKLLG